MYRITPTIRDRIHGVIFGQAIGDALGLGAEFLSKRQVAEFYPDGLSHYDQFVRDWHRDLWTQGDWTDDTEQMLCIFDSLLIHKQVNLLDIAKRLAYWVKTKGKGVGKTVYDVVSDPSFLFTPHQAAKRIWEASGQSSAANGGIMRTSILGVWDYQNREHVISNAEMVCQLTHYDSRCVGSCVAICLMIRAFLQGEDELEDILQASIEAAILYDERIREYGEVAIHGTLEDLNLDEGLHPGEANTIGYTLKTLAAGWWAMKHAASFQDGLLAIIHEGGDADTNGAVAGACLGARFGLSHIPQQWVNALLRKEELQERLRRLEALLKSME